jgi:hypothetical protein
MNCYLSIATAWKLASLQDSSPVKLLLGGISGIFDVGRHWEAGLQAVSYE